MYESFSLRLYKDEKKENSDLSENYYANTLKNRKSYDNLATTVTNP